jgi:hypothetical protein
VVDDLPNNEAMISTMQVSQGESDMIDANFMTADDDEKQP